jgi:hypothetical protein
MGGYPVAQRAAGNQRRLPSCYGTGLAQRFKSVTGSCRSMTGAAGSQARCAASRRHRIDVWDRRARFLTGAAFVGASGTP